jgi:hypothetical protein
VLVERWRVARTLLFVLSCYAPAVPIPGFLLSPGPLARLLAQPVPTGDHDLAAAGQRRFVPDRHA